MSIFQTLNFQYPRSRSELKDCDNDLGKIFIEDKVFELPFNRALFIDSTWRQSKSMYRATTKATEGISISLAAFSRFEINI